MTTKQELEDLMRKHLEGYLIMGEPYGGCTSSLPEDTPHYSLTKEAKVLSDERIKELFNLDGLEVTFWFIRAVRTAIEEAVAENDKAWQWQLKNPESTACMVKAACVRDAIAEAVAAERAEMAGHQLLVEHHQFHHQQEKIAEMQMAALKREIEGEVKE